MNFSEDMKKVLLAGIGAVAATAEKGQAVIDMLVKKGEMTVEQGRSQRRIKAQGKILRRARTAAPEGGAETAAGGTRRSALAA